MTGDFTRNSHRPDRRYSAVRMQQGRVLLDADWNEQSDIAADAARAEARDVIGPCGFPQDDAGFGLVPVPGDIAITPGRGYVDGMAAVNPPPAPVTLERVSGAGANTVWQVAAGPVLVVGQPLTPPDGDLSAAATVRTTAQGPDGRQQVTLSAAIGAADTVARAAAASLGAQPWLPGAPLPGKGEFLAYLEVWERPIGALEDPHLREIALGGPDTAQRLQTIWQVRLLDLAPLIADGAVQAPPSCKSFPAGWRPDGGAAPALLAARAEAGSAAADPCALPAAGGYRSLENHLYRVEIHGGGTVGDGGVTMKWSRDNAMHRAALLNIDGAALVVDDAGRDDATGFAPGEWLEVLDEARVLDGRPGFMVKLGEVNGERLAVAQILDPDTLAPLLDGGAPDMAKLPAAGQVRRWEGGAPVPVASGWMPLENGLEVRLSKGALRCGDHWTIPARTVSADIDWPQDPSGAGPLALPPEGVIRRFCPLAIVFHDGAGGWKPGDDCRRMFPPLSAMESFDCLGGDGQEATPDLTKPTARVALGAPLRVGVARGAAPVQGRLVRFSVEDNAPAAALSAPPGADVVSATNARLILRTDAEGVAQALLALHPGRHAHTVTAELLDASVPAQADRAHLPIRFTATLSAAARTAYDPADCAYQQSPDIAPGTARTVQQALDKLCPAPTLRALGGDGQLLCAGKDAPAPLRVGAFWGKRGPVDGIATDPPRTRPPPRSRRP